MCMEHPRNCLKIQPPPQDQLLHKACNIQAIHIKVYSKIIKNRKNERYKAQNRARSEPSLGFSTVAAIKDVDKN